MSQGLKAIVEEFAQHKARGLPFKEVSTSAHTNTHTHTHTHERYGKWQINVNIGIHSYTVNPNKLSVLKKSE